MNAIIISRHDGAVAWLRRELPWLEDAPVVAHATAVDVVARDVFGVLPLDLAALATSVTIVVMPGLRADQRGQDLTPEEMDAAGAHLEVFQVRRFHSEMRHH